MLDEAVVLDYEGLELVLVFNCLLLVGFDLLARAVDVVTGVLEPLLGDFPSLLFLPQPVFQLVEELSVGGLPVIQRPVGLLKLLDRLEHFLALFVVPRDDLVLLLEGF